MLSLKKNWKRQIVWLIAVLFVLDLVVFFAGLRPFRAVEERRLALRNDLRRQFEERKKEVARLRDIQSKVEVAREQADGFVEDRLLPQKEGFSAIVNELDSIAAATAVRKGNVNFKTKSLEGHNLLEVGMTTSVEGDYPSLVRFVNRIEQSKRFFIIENLSLASSPTTPVIKLNMRLLTYFTT